MAVARIAWTLVVAAVLAGCGRPDVPEDEPAKTPPPLPDTLARADSIVADLKKREAEQREQEAKRQQPPGGIPVVNEFPGQARRFYRQPSYQTYSVPPEFHQRAEESRWKSEAQFLDIQLQTSLKYADASLARMEAANAEMARMNTATYAEAQREHAAAAADYQQFMQAVESSRRNIERLRDAARRANVPPGWARWP